MGSRIKAIAVTVLATVLICSSAAFGAGAVDPSVPVYDPRPDGVSPMRNRYWGTCWAQAGIATMEAYLIHQGLEDSSYQLSVEDVLWRSRGGVEATSWNLQTREDSASPPAATGYLTTFGPRLESDIPKEIVGCSSQ